MNIGRTKKGYVVWTDQLDRFLRQCLAKKMTRSAIATELGLTKNAIVGRVYRMSQKGLL